jgi:aspartyl aminopeptidase
MTLEPSVALDLGQFLNAAVSPAHTVDEVKHRLLQVGYERLDERASWSFEPRQRFYVTRATGSIIAVESGNVPPSEAGYRIIGAHTDSPNLRLRPQFDVRSQGHALLSVEPYGSPLLHTWLDRDLSIAGTVVVAGVGPVLIRCPDPVARISSLAVHLNRDVNRQGLKLESQTHLRPTVALDFGGQEPSLLWDVIVEELGNTLSRPVERSEITLLDVGLFDVAGACIFGAGKELLASGRLDNLASCHAALAALTSAPPVGLCTRVMVLYDHEEVGSRSASGAQSSFLGDVLSRLASAAAGADREASERSLARSLMVSADMAHAVHPNFSDKHDEQHGPKLGGGPALKTNANQSYAADLEAMASVEHAARDAGVTLQRYAARNDIPCGSTIGPIAAARSGLRVTDIGNPMLSMHSCREVMAVADIEPYINVMRAWFGCEL